MRWPARFCYFDWGHGRQREQMWRLPCLLDLQIGLSVEAVDLGPSHGYLGRRHSSGLRWCSQPLDADDVVSFWTLSSASRARGRLRTRCRC